MSTQKTLLIVAGTVAAVSVAGVLVFVASQRIARDIARSAVENAAGAVSRDAIRAAQSIGQSLPLGSSDGRLLVNEERTNAERRMQARSTAIRSARNQTTCEAAGGFWRWGRSGRGGAIACYESPEDTTSIPLIPTHIPIQRV